MRPVMTYTFNIGTKLPFSQLGELVHRYLDGQGLESRRFLYYFMDIAADSELERIPPKYGCQRIVKDCPSLAPVRRLGYSFTEGMSLLWLSNIDKAEAETDEAIVPLMPRIHRRYGFSKTDLFWYDVNFFGTVLPFHRDYSRCRFLLSHFPDKDENEYIFTQPAGSGIHICRDGWGTQLTLSVDVLHGGEAKDPEIYFQALKAMLPRSGIQKEMKIYLDEDETAAAEIADEAAKPLIRQAKEIIWEALDEKELFDLPTESCSAVKAMKKAAKSPGWKYFKADSFICAIEKRTARGSIICISLRRNPPNIDQGIDLDITLQGAMFNHNLGGSTHAPINQAELDVFVQKALETVAELEKEIIPAIENLYPPSPDWLEPSLAEI